MKKTLLILGLISLSGSIWAANNAAISCSDSRISGQASSCHACFEAGTLYYRSDRAIENLNTFYDIFSVTSGADRIMWQDETTVNWGQLNNNFTLGSSININRDHTN
jgi:hypothetical protein